MKNILRNYSITVNEIKASVTQHDLLYYKSKPFQWLAYSAACLFGWHKAGFFITINITKK